MQTVLQTQWSWEEIKKHNQPLDGWIVIDDRVYDVTTFLDSHPGGAGIMGPYLGKDASPAFRGEQMEGIKTRTHAHSESSLSLIATNYIGLVEGSKLTEGLENPSACLDLSKPVLKQLETMGSKYYKVIDSPLHLHDSARIFEVGPFGNILEWMSRSSWWWVPSFWLPVMAGLLHYALATPFENGEKISPLNAFCWIAYAAMVCWTLMEFILHRWMFHCEHWLSWKMFSSKTFIQVHFVMHGVHHLFPSDKRRLVMPPWNASVVAIPLYIILASLMPRQFCALYFAGLLFGYICYDMTHYFLHFGGTKWSYLQALRTHHMVHHYTNVDEGYGVSSKLWDYLLGDLGHRTGVVTAQLGRWAIKGDSPHDELALAPYHLAVGCVVWFLIPHLVAKTWVNVVVGASAILA